MLPGDLDQRLGPTDACPLNLDSIPTIEINDGLIEVNMSDGLHRVREQDVLAYLTDKGKYPIEYSFLYGEWGALAIWQPSEGCIYFRRTMDNLLSAACRRYLKSRHQFYFSDKEVYSAAKMNEWPGWERAETRTDEV
jgi:hypothetical protein